MSTRAETYFAVALAAGYGHSCKADVVLLNDGGVQAVEIHQQDVGIVEA